jgi:putative flippase GtrA
MHSKTKPGLFRRESIGVLWRKSSVRYILVGGTVYILELLIIFAAQARGASPTTAVAISFTLGLIISFLLQKLFSFGDKRMHHKILIPQVVAVAVLVIWNFTFTIVITRLFESILPPTITRTIALAITTIWNYYLYKTRIFKHPETDE